VIPAINVDAPVDPIGVDDLGRVAVPTDVSRAGWYKWGPAPGNATGSAMITAHVDGVDQGPGAFFNLGELNVGDLVRVERADSSSLTYRVIARESFNKKAVPLEDVFARSGPPRLTLVTCGGPFDPQTLVYTDNIIVTAVPE
jgi:LPXTG-site transpeptidase (sortase) family protein